MVDLARIAARIISHAPGRPRSGRPRSVARSREARVHYEMSELIGNADRNSSSRPKSPPASSPFPVARFAGSPGNTN
jgi:hypothetical protein